MKKYITIFVLVIFLAPSIALASWWNPLTWFRGDTTSKNATTEVLERRIKELENKLNNGTTTPQENLVIKKEANVKPVAVKPTITPTVTQNMNTEIALKNSATDILNQEITAVDSFNRSVLEDISYMTSLKNNLLNFTDGSSESFVNHTDTRLASMKDVDARNKEMLASLRAEMNLLQSQPLSYFTTYQIPQDHYEVIQGLPSIVSNHISDFNNYKNEANDILQQINMQVQPSQDRSEALNAVNLKIARLNDKYARDVAVARNSSGGTVSGANATLRSITNRYNDDYNALMAEWQLIKYGN